jgi:hypothetical protein
MMRIWIWIRVAHSTNVRANLKAARRVGPHAASCLHLESVNIRNCKLITDACVCYCSNCYAILTHLVC